MKAKIFRGKLISIDNDQRTFLDSEGDEDTYSSEGLKIDEAWAKTHLGIWLDCTIIDGIIKTINEPKCVLHHYRQYLTLPT